MAVGICVNGSQQMRENEEGYPLARGVSAAPIVPASVLSRLHDDLPVVYPTSTLPGLGCLPNAKALDALFACKARDSLKVVSLGVASLEQAESLVHVDAEARAILDAFPRGSLTLVLPARETLDARLGGDGVAIRLLAHPAAIALATAVGPITATSANLSGVAPTADCTLAAQHLDLPEEAVLIGDCPGGAPSTLIGQNFPPYTSAAERWRIIREGIVPRQEVEAWSMSRT